MYHFKIKKYATFFSIRMNRQQRKNNFKIFLKIKAFLKDNLTLFEYNRRYRRFEVVKTMYLDNGKEIRMPLGYLNNFILMISKLDTKYSIINKHTNESRTIELNLKQGFKLKENQIEPTDFLISNKRQKALQFNTGGGKTFIAIAAITKLKQTSMICCTGLIDRWYSELLKISDISKDDIFIVQTFQKVKQLYEMVENGFQPKVILASIPTIYDFIKRKNNFSNLNYNYVDFIKKLGIGIKIFDEVHERFHQVATIEMVSNIEHNIYLSATYLNTNPFMETVFKTMFNDNVMFYGEESIKHTIVKTYAYKLLVNENKFKTARGYNQNRYESYILKNKSLYNEYFYGIIKPILFNEFLCNKINKEKALIFANTSAMCDYLRMKINEEFNDINCQRYCSSLGDKIDKNLYNPDVDITVTTFGSTGTGKDIANLFFILNTISFAAEIRAYQMRGRLRPIKGRPTIFIDIYNKLSKSHIYHTKYRHTYLKNDAKEFYEYEI